MSSRIKSSPRLHRQTDIHIEEINEIKERQQYKALRTCGPWCGGTFRAMLSDRCQVRVRRAPEASGNRRGWSQWTTPHLGLAGRHNNWAADTDRCRSEPLDHTRATPPTPSSPQTASRCESSAPSSQCTLQLENWEKSRQNKVDLYSGFKVTAP